jgi:hypothetical protein
MRHLSLNTDIIGMSKVKERQVIERVSGGERLTFTIDLVLEKRRAISLTHHHVSPLASQVNTISIPDQLRWLEANHEASVQGRPRIFLELESIAREVSFVEVKHVVTGGDTDLVCAVAHRSHGAASIGSVFASVIDGHIEAECVHFTCLKLLDKFELL